MMGFSISLKELIEEIPEILYFCPSLVFGYLFSLIGDFRFLAIAMLWATIPSTIAGMNQWITGGSIDKIIEYLVICTVAIYGFLVGPLALLASLNNLIPERHEVHISNWIPDFNISPDHILVELVHGPLATTDFVLLVLFALQFVSYIYLFGFFFLSLPFIILGEIFG